MLCYGVVWYGDYDDWILYGVYVGGKEGGGERLMYPYLYMYVLHTYL